MEIKKITPRPIKSVAKFTLHTIKKVTQTKKYSGLYKKYSTGTKFTMVPRLIFFDNLSITEEFSKIPGCVVECGVWRGGMIAAIADILGDDRKYYLFDSFEGLPAAKEIDGEEALRWQKNTTGYNYYDNCKAEIDFAQRAMDKTSTEYYLYKGWFCDTLSGFKPQGPIALLRLDGDWYDSTMDCLKNLYQNVNFGGVIIFDDYYTWDGCSRAVHDFLSSINSVSRVSTSNDGICYIIKKDRFTQEEMTLISKRL